MSPCHIQFADKFKIHSPRFKPGLVEVHHGVLGCCAWQAGDTHAARREAKPRASLHVVVAGHVDKIPTERRSRWHLIRRLELSLHLSIQLGLGLGLGLRWRWRWSLRLRLALTKTLREALDQGVGEVGQVELSHSGLRGCGRRRRRRRGLSGGKRIGRRLAQQSQQLVT